MGIGEGIEWSNTGLDKLREDLDAGVTPIRIDFPEGRKGSEEHFYTFIGSDAIAELRRYFKVRPDSDEAIFITRYKSPLSEGTARRYWIDTLHRLAIITQLNPSKSEPTEQIRYGKNIHEIRDTMRSRWRLSGADVEVAEFMMGHSHALDKYGYDKSPWDYPQHFKEQYTRAEPWMNILSMDPTVVARDEVERLRRELEEAKRGQNVTVKELQSKVDALSDAVRLLMERLEREEQSRDK